MAKMRLFPSFQTVWIWVGLQTLSQIPLGNLLHQQLFFVRSSFNRRVEASVVAMGKLLYEVKGGGQGVAISKSEINAAADAILEPLMDLLEGSLTTYAKICDKSVLKRLLKELWKIVIRSLEKNIVLPPAQDKSVRISPKKGRNFLVMNSFSGCYQKHCQGLCQHSGKAQKSGRCHGIFQGKVQWKAGRQERLECCLGKIF